MTTTELNDDDTPERVTRASMAFAGLAGQLAKQPLHAEYSRETTSARTATSAKLRLITEPPATSPAPVKPRPSAASKPPERKTVTQPKTVDQFWAELRDVLANAVAKVPDGQGKTNVNKSNLGTLKECLAAGMVPRLITIKPGHAAGEPLTLMLEFQDWQEGVYRPYFHTYLGAGTK